MSVVVAFFKEYGPIMTFLVSVTGVGAGLIYYLKNKKIKKLEYLVTNTTPIFNQLHSKMKIYFDEKEVKENVYLSILTIENIGNDPIKEEEFEKGYPLHIILKNDDAAPVKILDVEIYQSNPSDFNISLEYVQQDGMINLYPILFNPKDYITLKLISTKFEQISILGRIIGGIVTNGEKRKKRQRKVRVFRSLIIGAPLLILGLCTDQLLYSLYPNYIYVSIASIIILSTLVAYLFARD
ncbi:TPA: hypothetical protein ACHVJ6_005540 [Bacillus cereus]